MLKEKPTATRNALTAYISESQDREGNIFYVAAICDDEKDELVRELSGYSIDALEKDVLREYPGIKIETEVESE